MAETEMVLEDLHTEPDVEKEQFMTFRCENEIYGVSIKYVNEIIGLSQITAIPETEDYIRGLINLRGKIIPVIDVRIRFGKQPLEYNDRTSVIVLDVNTTVIGIIVDGIDEVVAFAEDEITPPPSVSSLESQSRKYVFGIGRVGNDVKLLLDPDKLINGSEKEKPEENSESDEDEDE